MRINDIVLVKCLKLSGRRRCGNPRRMALFNPGLAFTMLLSFHLFSSHVALDNKAKSYIELEAHVVGVIIFTCQNGGVSLFMCLNFHPLQKSHKPER